MENHKGKRRPPSGKVESGASEMSMLVGSDTSESTATESAAQEMPVPRSYEDATGETSKAAANKARSTSSTMCRAILSYIAENSAASPEELCEALSPIGFSRLTNTWRARCSDLAHAGLLVDSGQRGMSDAGSRVIKWALAASKGGDE